MLFQIFCAVQDRLGNFTIGNSDCRFWRRHHIYKSLYIKGLHTGTSNIFQQFFSMLFFSLLLAFMYIQIFQVHRTPYAKFSRRYPLKGCALHWTKAVWSLVQQFGLATTFTQRESALHVIKQLLALPFLPWNHIEKFFRVMEECAPANIRTQALH